MNRIEETKILLQRFEQEKTACTAAATVRYKCYRCALYSAGVAEFETLFDFQRFDSMLRAISSVKRQLAQQNTKVLLARRRIQFDVVYQNAEFNANQSMQIARFATDNQVLVYQFADRQETIRRLQQHLDNLRLENDAIAHSSPSTSAKQGQIAQYCARTLHDHYSYFEESLSVISSDSAQGLKTDSACAYDRSPPSYSMKSDRPSPNSQEFRRLCQTKNANKGYYTMYTMSRTSQPFATAEDQKIYAYSGSPEASPYSEQAAKAARIEDIYLDFDDF